MPAELIGLGYQVGASVREILKAAGSPGLLPGGDHAEYVVGRDSGIQLYEQAYHRAGPPPRPPVTLWVPETRLTTCDLLLRRLAAPGIIPWSRCA